MMSKSVNRQPKLAAPGVGQGEGEAGRDRAHGEERREGERALHGGEEGPLDREDGPG